MFLDPTKSAITVESVQDKEKRLYKTTDRKIYDDASARGGGLFVTGGRVSLTDLQAKLIPRSITQK